MSRTITIDKSESDDISDKSPEVAAVRERLRAVGPIMMATALEAGANVVVVVMVQAVDGGFESSVHVDSWDASLYAHFETVQALNTVRGKILEGMREAGLEMARPSP